MNSLPVEPGSVIGVLGGGQLGAMFAAAGRRLGYRIAVWDPDVEAPAHRVADHSFPAAFSDSSTLAEFSRTVSAVTYEWENVPASVCETLESHVVVRPASRILKVLQDRVEQKRFLAAHRLPASPFRVISKPEDLTIADALGFPCLCKTATAGYDGKGQWKISARSEIPSVERQLSQNLSPTTRWVLEQFLDFDRELSILVVRGSDGDCRTYPVVENLHEAGILRMTHVPASVGQAVAEKATTLARSTVEALQGVGVFCVEIFLMRDGELLINEVAPRPHNSGHYTLDACTVSQFEQQVRALCGLPLGEIRVLSPAVMLNLIGDEIRMSTGQGRMTVLGIPGASLHLYGKRSVRPGRKMGHVTFMADKLEAAIEKAMTVRQQLSEGGRGRP